MKGLNISSLSRGGGGGGGGGRMGAGLSGTPVVESLPKFFDISLSSPKQESFNIIMT